MPSLGTRVSLLFGLFTFLVVAGVVMTSGRHAIELSAPSLARDTIAARYAAVGDDVCTLATFDDTYELLPGAQYVELRGGHAAFVGELVERANPTRRWLVELSLRVAVEPKVFGVSTGVVLPRELPEASYVDAGGPVDPGAWRYYRDMTGSMHGLDALIGERLTLSNDGGSLFQVGRGAGGNEVADGGAVRFLYQAESSEDPEASALWHGGQLRFDLLEREHNTALMPLASDVDDVSVLIIPDLDPQTYVLASGGEWSREPDGTARFDAFVVSPSEPQARWRVRLTCSAPSSAGMRGFPPDGSPVRELDRDQYAEFGGPACVLTWSYYEGLQGALVGEGKFAGSIYQLGNGEYALQVGTGANGLDTHFGLSGDLRGRLVSGAIGELPRELDDVRLRGRLEPHATYRVTCAGPGEFLSVPALGSGFAIAGDAACFRESSDGTAFLAADVVRVDEPADRWRLSVEWSARGTPGGWRTYEQAAGSLVGLGTNAGAHFELRAEGAVLAVGPGVVPGAREGARAALSAHLLRQPEDGRSLPWFVSAVELTFGLAGECEDCPRQR